MASDSTLRADIEAELEFEPIVNAANIGVAVKDGVATLTGHVVSYGQKVAAERAAGRVKGVRAVAEEIEVRLPFEAYRRNAELESSGITIVVDGSKVTLSGKVKAWHERRAAENAAWAIPSVTEVIDNLVVS